MDLARLKAFTAAGAVAVCALAAPVVAAPTAHADSCSYSSSLTKSDINAWGYVGYEEMQYSAGCHTVRTHLHIDSGFLSSHSGWNVTTYLSGGLNSDGLPQYNVITTQAPANTSWPDYYSAPASIYGYPTELFTSFVDWQYDGCKIEQATYTHNFSNGDTLGNGIGYVNQGCHS